MSHFGDLIGTTSPKTEPAVVVEPDPVVEEKPLNFDKMSKKLYPYLKLLN